MRIIEENILKNHCYTELVYDRINKKLKTNYSKKEIEQFIRKILKETAIENYKSIGKNFYVTNDFYGIKITVNSNTFRIITVDKL